MLRDYQTALKTDIYNDWNSGARNVLAVSPTGSGKTRLKSNIAAEMGVPSCAIAHRQELVGQISLALAFEGVRHRLIAPKATVQSIIRQHVKQTGRSWYAPEGQIGVAGVDTLIRAREEQWFSRVQVWDIDEAHHVLPENKWGTAIKLFPHARGLGVTATPLRSDNKSLGRATGGVFDTMCVGPLMRDLIDRGYLADYRIFAPKPSIDTSAVAVGASGEFSPKGLADASHKSTITGDIVRDYLRFAPGKLGITFVVDVATATEVASAYNAAGVRAEAISANTPDDVRFALLERFRAGEIKQLVNVDLFGEGFDVPGVEVVSMGRPTQSYGLFVQQFGRALRTSPGKTHGVIIDHVGNICGRHGLPDAPREWVLDDFERGTRRKREDDDAIPITACTACFQIRDRFLKVCPYCGHVEVPAARDKPELVDGDLFELSADVLAQMRGGVARIDSGPLIPYGATDIVAGAVRKRHRERQEAQGALRAAIAQWAGYRRYEGADDPEIYRRFYLSFGIDVMSAQALGAREANDLLERITV